MAGQRRISYSGVVDGKANGLYIRFSVRRPFLTWQGGTKNRTSLVFETAH